MGDNQALEFHISAMESKSESTLAQENASLTLQEIEKPKQALGKEVTMRACIGAENQRDQASFVNSSVRHEMR